MNIQQTLQIAAIGTLSAFLTSCKLPPREAMKRIQSEGLIAYLSSDRDASHYERVTGSPFIPQRAYVTPRPVTPIPYRSTYHTNRHMKADHNRVPYRPKNSPSSVASSEARDSAKVQPPAPPKMAIANDLPGNPAATTPAPSSPSPSPTTLPATKPAENLPYGTPVSGRPGMVTSPYAQKHQLVDVTGLPAGDTVKDPYTGKLFRVPPTQQASAKPLATPTPEKPEAGATPKP